MKYRTLPHGGEQLSIIGMGTSMIGELPEEEIIATVRAAVDAGVNCFDMAGGYAAAFGAFGKALKGMRDRVYLQIHFGADYRSGVYGWSTDLEVVKASVAWQLSQLQTDYIDFGFIHCLDEESDLEAYRENGVLDYVLSLKARGVIRHIGLSSHTPALVNRVLDMGIVDILLFSINPLYDYGRGDYGFGESGERYDLYRRCQKEGVGITVMKPFCGGKLLDAARSPFGVALTQNQCIHYALDRPAVLSVMGGYANEAQLCAALSYLNATEEELDYSCVGAFAPSGSVGQCVYCKHCHPCPAGLDIALINKYYDLALLGDALAKEHYLTLEKKAGDCVQCGHCDGRCPFRVAQSERMQTIQAYFGE